MLGKYLYEMDEAHWKETDTAFNFGPMEESFVTVEEMAKMVSHEFGNREFQIKDSLDQIKHEAQILKLDSSKAICELGWAPTETLSNCIHHSVQFAKREQAGEDIARLSREFVIEYLRERRSS